MHVDNFYAKTLLVILKYLSKTSSFLFLSNLVILTTTLFYLALTALKLLLLVVQPTKPLSPRD